MQKIQIRVFFSICALLFISMLLVNFVFVMLWQRDALQQEGEKNKITLTGIQALLPSDCPDVKKTSPAALSFVHLLPTPSSVHIQVYYYKKGLLPLPDDVFGQVLNNVVKQAATTGHYVSRHTGSFFSFADHHKRLIAAAEPIIRQGRVAGGVGIVRSLEPLFQKMWQAEKTILAYILINLLVLGVVAFFRMGKLIARPIDRLVRLADQYGDREQVLFALDNDKPGNEFGRLAISLNSMLSRIDRDRLVLENSVRDLESANHKLQEQQQEMIRTEKLASVGRLAAGLAHEIGNPLGVVQGYLGLLKQDDIAEKERKDFAGRSEQEIRRIDGLVRQLLDFSRLNSTRKEKVSLHVLLGNIVELVACQSCMKNVSIIKKITAEQDVVSADPDKLKQVFLNCFLNAADALAESSWPEKTIIITTNQLYLHDDNTSGPAGIEVAITDNGVGITEEDYPNIFDPFFTTKEPGQGTGLGLSVAYSIIEGYGGSMRIESKAGKGTTVFVELPLG